MLCGLGFGKARLRDGTGLCQVTISTIICLGAPTQITTVVHMKIGVCLQTLVKKFLCFDGKRVPQLQYTNIQIKYIKFVCFSLIFLSFYQERKKVLSSIFSVQQQWVGVRLKTTAEPTTQT